MVRNNEVDGGRKRDSPNSDFLLGLQREDGRFWWDYLIIIIGR